MLCVSSPEQRVPHGAAPGDPSVYTVGLGSHTQVIVREDVPKERRLANRATPLPPSTARFTSAASLRACVSATRPATASARDRGRERGRERQSLWPSASQIAADTPAAAARRLAMERATRFGARRVYKTPNIEDYAQTGLRAYRPANAARNKLGWVESRAGAESVQSTAQILVRVPGAAARPLSARGKYDPRRNRLTDQLGVAREAVRAPETPVTGGGLVAATQTTHKAWSVCVEIAHDLSLDPTQPATRRPIAAAGLRDRSSRRKHLCVPRMVPTQPRVSDTTMRVLVRRCKAEVTEQKQLAGEADACEAKRVSISVRSTAGQSAAYDVSIGATTMQFKGVVAAEGCFKLSVSGFRLFFRGKVLRDDETLEASGVTKPTTLILARVGEKISWYKLQHSWRKLLAQTARGLQPEAETGAEPEAEPEEWEMMMADFFSALTPRGHLLPSVKASEGVGLEADSAFPDTDTAAQADAEATAASETAVVSEATGLDLEHDAAIMKQQ